MLRHDMIGRAKKELPSEIDWVWEKEGWVNDRVEAGPFTTRKKDNQGDIVVMGEKRLDYIFKFGHLIYEHHADASLPVEILADCLAIGHDKVGKTYGIWGWHDGSETIDDRWEESQQWGKDAGYSIGGKKTRVEMVDGVRHLINPEVLEISKTRKPANNECPVYYINQLAKSTIAKSEGTNDSFEIKTAVKQMEKKLSKLFELEEGETVIDPEDMMERYPCTKEYVMGLQEVSNGFIKSDNARLMLTDRLESIKKSVITMPEEKQEPSIKKMDYGTPGSETTPAPGANVTLDLLTQIVAAIADLKTAMMQIGSAAPAMPQEPGADQAMPEEPPMEKPSPEEPPGEEPGNNDREEPSTEEQADEKKYKKSKDGDLELPEGENPEPEGPLPAVDTEVPSTEEIDLPEGENPDPEGPAPDVPETEVEHGDVDDNSPVHGVEGMNDEASTDVEPAQGGEDLSKSIVKPKPIVKTDTWQELAKRDGIMVFKVDMKPVPQVDDPRAETMNKATAVVQKTETKSVFQMLKETNGNIPVPMR